MHTGFDSLPSFIYNYMHTGISFYTIQNQDSALEMQAMH